MNSQRHTMYIERLHARERELETALSRVGAAARAEREPDAQDVGDRAADSYSKETRLRELDQDRQWLGWIRDALLRHAEGAYGICLNCGQPVEEKRLEAAPWARHCLACQKLQDQGLLPS